MVRMSSEERRAMIAGWADEEPAQQKQATDNGNTEAALRKEVEPSKEVSEETKNDNKDV